MPAATTRTRPAAIGRTPTNQQRHRTFVAVSRPPASPQEAPTPPAPLPWPHLGGPRRAAAAGAVGAAGARVARRADPPGRRCEQLAAAGRGHVPGPLVPPLLRAGEEQRADDPGLAVLARRGAGARAHVVDAAAPSGSAARPGRVTAAQVPTPRRRRALERRRPGHHGDLRRGVRGPVSPGCCATCRCRSQGGSAPTGCSGCRRRPASPARWAGR